ncbi:MAG: acyl-CoA dehydrogenase family protein [Rhodopseudomonas sp.]|uniref:acyl-CoA dehydrogenase family protein n=1 Tax=Rhodopseudomonas sp. TaxID=1078 RepID=UPI001794E0DD|nr:acyl-CoA dehydrogenase family protein [Rhodopseudomonas sp.]NVN88299.1 acyl-CoA dehydrogenase family protein [Rhodopseudomonas sp.]
MNQISVSAAPTADSLIASARDLIPLLKEVGASHDSSKRISDDVARRLREAGFFRICQSVENGGYGMRPSVLWRVAREIARGDSATAWILSLAGLHPWMAGMFPVAAQDEVFHGGKDAVVIALTGNVGRGVDAVLEDGHYCITGKWTYASGIDVADWAAVLVEVPTQEGGKEQRLLLVPQASFRIDHDSWNVFGMQGTGSKDVYLSDERVPAYRTLKWLDLQRAQVPGTERNRGPMYSIPHTSLFVMSVAAPIVAVASGLLDIYIETVKKRIPAGLNSPQTEDRFSLAELGKAASKIDMAFNQLMHDVDEMWDQAVAGKEFSIEQRTRYRANGPTICDTALAASNDLVRNLGGSLLPLGPVERYFRDLHSMAAHFLMQANPAAELYGRALLGMPLPPNARI